MKFDEWQSMKKQLDEDYDKAHKESRILELKKNFRGKQILNDLKPSFYDAK